MSASGSSSRASSSSGEESETGGVTEEGLQKLMSMLQGEAGDSFDFGEEDAEDGQGLEEDEEEEDEEAEESGDELVPDGSQSEGLDFEALSDAEDAIVEQRTAINDVVRLSFCPVDLAHFIRRPLSTEY